MVTVVQDLSPWQLLLSSKQFSAAQKNIKSQICFCEMYINYIYGITYSVM